MTMPTNTPARMRARAAAGRLRDPDAPVTFFFVGNCQLQYFAREVARAFPEQVLMTGRPQVPFDGPLPRFVPAMELFAEARRRKAAGGETILVVQETNMGQFTRVVGPAREGGFTQKHHFPFAHFNSIWPHRATSGLKLEINFTPRMVRRLFEAEKYAFGEALDRCGASNFDREAFWQSALDDLEFYHPGHPNARVLLSLYDGFLHRTLRRVDERKAADIRRAIVRSSGLPLTCRHPIEPQWGDALGASWHLRPSYAAWTLLRNAESLADVLKAEEAKEDFSRQFDRYIGGLFRHDLTNRFVEFGDMARAAANSAEVAVSLPGQTTLLNRAVYINTRYGDWDAVEAALTASRDYLRPGTQQEARLSKWLKRFSRKSEPREIIRRLASSSPNLSWLGGLVEGAPVREAA